jgi:alpha-maltose-1-phosphate synthase
MNILLLTNEYPPRIYGGAGVHVEHLSREMAALSGGDAAIQVLSFGDQNETDGAIQVRGIPGSSELFGLGLPRSKLADALYRNVVMAGSAGPADVIHCHTWYSHLAGCLLREILGAPMVLTTHSLEPHRPWKREQLGDSYAATCWIEKTAMATADGIIAVSKAMKTDVQTLYGTDPDRIRVIYNGIDADRFRKIEEPDIIRSYGIDPDTPFILFVGRITRQKGILHLVNALPHLDPGIQVVLCAGAPDTPAIGEEMEAAVTRSREKTPNPVIWIDEMVPIPNLIALYSHAALFVCPSVYEPFGIINLEAMACRTPVAAAAVGGIREVVVHEETGLLVSFDPVGNGNADPLNPDKYARDLAAAVNRLMADPDRRRAMGWAARSRVEERFSWKSIARQTLDCYADLIR